MGGYRQAKLIGGGRWGGLGFFWKRGADKWLSNKLQKKPKKIITLLKDVSLGRFSCATSA
jgi:hypothetical protein